MGVCAGVSYCTNKQSYALKNVCFADVSVQTVCHIKNSQKNFYEQKFMQ